MPTVLTEQCGESDQDASSADTPKYLFVATSLATWTTANPEWFARDFQIDDTVYRRLDPEYYAWLRSRMQLAKKEATSGQFPPGAFEDLRVGFNGIHDWAVGHFGEAALLAAVRVFRSGGYEAPAADDEGRYVPVPVVRMSAAEAISPEAMASVDSISERAVSLGWKRERLNAVGGNRVCNPRCGLVCFLRPGDSIGEVTAQSIEIIHPPPSEVRHRFYNPDVDHPWIRRVR